MFPRTVLPVPLRRRRPPAVFETTPCTSRFPSITTVTAPVSVSVAPPWIVRSLTVRPIPVCGSFGVPDGMRTLSVVAGTTAGFQLPAVPHALLTAPVHTTAGGVDGQVTTAPLVACTKPP